MARQREIAVCTAPGGGRRRRALLKCPTQPRRLARCASIAQTCITISVGIEYFADRWLERIGPEPSFRQTGRATDTGGGNGWGEPLRSNWFHTPDYPGYDVRNHFEYFIAQTGGTRPALQCPRGFNPRPVTIGLGETVSNFAGPFVHYPSYSLAGRDYLDVSVSETRWIVHSNWRWLVHDPDTLREFFAATQCPWPGGPLPTITLSWEELTGEETRDDHYCIAEAGSPEADECRQRHLQWSNVMTATGIIRVYLIVSGRVEDGDQWTGMPGDLEARLLNMVYEFSYDDYEGRARRTVAPSGYLERIHTRVGGILIDNLNPETWGYTDLIPELPDPPPVSWDCWDASWFRTQYVQGLGGFGASIQDWP